MTSALPQPSWWTAIGRYLIAVTAGNLAWEFGQMPLYRPGQTGTRGGHGKYPGGHDVGCRIRMLCDVFSSLRAIETEDFEPTAPLFAGAKLHAPIEVPVGHDPNEASRHVYDRQSADVMLDHLFGDIADTGFRRYSHNISGHYVQCPHGKFLPGRMERPIQHSCIEMPRPIRYRIYRR
jgi:hypothetical protein